MHEITIACALFDLVQRQVLGYPHDRVSGVTMSIGALQAVEPSAIELCFGLMAEGTNIAGAILTIDRRPLRAFCRDCGREQVVDAQYRCGCCLGEKLQAFSSSGMTLERILLHGETRMRETVS
jgi:hydrogenase nickel incorporation protein HypA/HybF